MPHIWTQVAERAKPGMSAAQHRRLFSTAALVQLPGGAWLVRARTPLHAEQLAREDDLIRPALALVLKRAAVDVEVRYSPVEGTVAHAV